MARHSRSSRYSAYTGGPDPLAPPVDLREALEQIGQAAGALRADAARHQKHARRGQVGRRG